MDGGGQLALWSPVSFAPSSLLFIDTSLTSWETHVEELIVTREWLS